MCSFYVENVKLGFDHVISKLELQQSMKLAINHAHFLELVSNVIQTNNYRQ